MGAYQNAETPHFLGKWDESNTCWRIVKSVTSRATVRAEGQGEVERTKAGISAVLVSLEKKAKRN